MSLGILSSPLQLVQKIKDHPYAQQLQNLGDRIALLIEEGRDYSHVTVKKSRLQLIRISAAVCGIELCYAAETAFVSPILLKLGVPVIFMTLVWCVSPFLGFFLNPIMGSLSDRCRSGLGRRRPFILAMSTGIFLGLILVPNGESLGLAMGDAGPEEKIPLTENVTTPPINVFNDTITNSSKYPEDHSVTINNSTSWLVVKLPPNHLAGIMLTIIGVALLDLNCDACQSPCRTYLLEVCVREDHPRGLTSFTVMAGLGGSVGYCLGGIDWNATRFGEAFGGHVRVVFTIVLICFVICVICTVTSFKEIPLEELGITKEHIQKSATRVQRKKYKKFINESSEEESEAEKTDIKVTSMTLYGTVTEPTSKTNLDVIENSKNSIVLSLETTSKTQQDEEEGLNKREEDASSENNENLKDRHTGIAINILLDASVKDYLMSIIKMPRSMMVLCLTNLFCWMSLVCYSLYFTDFVGQAVFRGDPKAPLGSEEHNRYDDGVRMGSFGMSLYSFSCAIYSLMVEKLIEKLKARNVYVGGQLVYSLGMVIMAVTRNKAAVLILSTTAGIMYATLFTMPYVLIAHYHSSGQFSQNQDDKALIRGLGTDVAVVSSMVFLAQFILSSVMGSIVHLAGSTVTIVIAAAILSFCGAVSATQVTYLGL
ncbi:hypothetical protein CHS0354_032700 [Potamilus streckersoni]|uniref:Proton-associated sugar transporter A n=1 Tax=Potamilus streckersoni TaxID=2493646 RepID=A0AAE0RQD3_9BIVA|nr:hypothetical protein CHS0354_032700 [Potamilus streckersoni]